MDFIINNSISPGKHCFYSSLYNLLKNYDYREHELFFLCEGFEYYYEINQIASGGSPRQRLSFISYDKSLMQLSNKLYGQSNEMFHIGYEFITEQFEQILYLNRPILLMVQSSILDYHLLVDPLNMFHCILLLGMDQKRGFAYIVDSYNIDSMGNIFVYKGFMPIDVLQKHTVGSAWLKKDIPMKRGNELFLENIIASFHNVVNTDYFTGFRMYIKDVTMLCEESPDRIQEEMLQLIYTLKVHLTFYLDYIIAAIQQIFQNTGVIYNHIINCVDELKKDWNNFIILILKKITLSNYIKPNLNNIKASSNKILDKQDNLFKNINSVLMII